MQTRSRSGDCGGQARGSARVTSDPVRGSGRGRGRGRPRGRRGGLAAISEDEHRLRSAWTQMQHKHDSLQQSIPQEIQPVRQSELNDANQIVTNQVQPESRPRAELRPVRNNLTNIQLENILPPEAFTAVGNISVTDNSDTQEEPLDLSQEHHTRNSSHEQVPQRGNVPSEEFAQQMAQTYVRMIYILWLQRLAMVAQMNQANM